MRLSVPLAFLAIVATLLFINLGWWVHYHEPSEEPLNMHPGGSAGGGSRPGSGGRAAGHERPAAPAGRIGGGDAATREVAVEQQQQQQQQQQQDDLRRARQAEAAAKDEALKIERYNLQQKRDAQAADAEKQRQAAAAAAAAAATKPKRPENPAVDSDVKWDRHVGKSCQGYADGDSKSRSLADSQEACQHNVACAAIECPTGRDTDCTLRAIANLVPYQPVDCWVLHDDTDPNHSPDGKRKIALHPEYMSLLHEYPFQSVRTNTGKTVNIMLVRSAPNKRQIEMYERLKDHILFLGISSFEDFPKPSVNPFSPRYPEDKYVGMFPGFLHMLRPDDAAKTFPPHVKLLLMSQSDFALPNHKFRDYSVPRKYDFSYSGSDQDVRNDCVGWSSFAKNWSFVKEALNVMCGEFKLTGVLVATIDKANKKRCTIPKSCDGLITQTQYISQREFHSYVEQSRFLFLPQIHDASPRVSTQALALDVPLLMNAYISGGWKYLNEKTGEWFHDLSDFREALRKIVENADVPYHYEPRKWVTERYGNKKSCARLYEFVKNEFPDWAATVLPKGTNCLLI